VFSATSNNRSSEVAGDKIISLITKKMQSEDSRGEFTINKVKINRKDEDGGEGFAEAVYRGNPISIPFYYKEIKLEYNKELSAGSDQKSSYHKFELFFDIPATKAIISGEEYDLRSATYHEVGVFDTSR
jgi:hypothetical protein